LTKLLSFLTNAEPSSAQDLTIASGSKSPSKLNNGDEYEEKEAPAEVKTNDFKIKVKRALKAILEKTLSLEALDPLVQLTTPPNILKHVLAQLAKILPNDVSARRRFVTTGCCQRVQEIAAAYRARAQEGTNEMSQASDNEFSGTKLAESIRQINACFPEEIVRYYSPGYSAVLLQKLDEYANPNVHPAVHFGNTAPRPPSGTAALEKNAANDLQMPPTAPPTHKSRASLDALNSSGPAIGTGDATK
jgi:hypothetical protein